MYHQNMLKVCSDCFRYRVLVVCWIVRSIAQPKFIATFVYSLLFFLQLLVMLIHLRLCLCVYCELMHDFNHLYF